MSDKMSHMEKKYTPIMVALLIVASFAIGSMWTKIQYLQQAPSTKIQETNTKVTPTPTAQPVVAAPKSDKPNVELFVMSYCPYGLQTQKAIVPVVELLGGKINFTPRWVSYAMHGQKEMEENLRQYCIYKEQPAKYLSYLRCFVTANNYTDCLQKNNIDVTACYNGADAQFGIMKAFNDKASWLSGQFPKFSIDEALNTKYSVQGSPSLVINGVKVSAPRSAEDLKKIICNSFNSPPAECQKTLTATQEAPGAGAIGMAYTPSAGSGQAGCQ